MGDSIALPFTEYLLCQDIGKKQDDSTSMLARLTPEYFDTGDGRRRMATFLDIVYMDKRRIGYMELGDFTKELLQAIALGDRCILLIDGTGIGEAVYDIYTHLGMDPVKIIFTSGETASIERKRAQFSDRFSDISGYKVPKVDMVSAAQVLFQQGRIRFAEGIGFRDECFQQLQAFVGKVNEKTHNVKYENLTEDIHDDFVVVVLMLAWYVMHMDSSLIVQDDRRGLGFIQPFERSRGGYSVDPFSDL